MKKAYPNYRVTDLCRLLGVPTSIYYYQRKPRALVDITLCRQIKAIAQQTGHTYGQRRIQAQLRALGHSISLYKCAKLMKQAGVVAYRPKRRPGHSSSCGGYYQVENRLKRQFNPIGYNQSWVGDITLISTGQGWCYLACVMDLATKEIVGYHLSDVADTGLVLSALRKAIRRQRPNTCGLLFHSDQGVQYGASLFQEALRGLQMVQSMSRRGNCLDNAVMERFFRSLKSECLNHIRLLDRDHCLQEVANYMSFYNYERRHSGIGYRTPHQKYIEMKNAA